MLQGILPHRYFDGALFVGVIKMKRLCFGAQCYCHSEHGHSLVYLFLHQIFPDLNICLNTYVSKNFD